MKNRDALLQTYRDGLLNDVVPFWLQHGMDLEHGGVFTALDRDGSLIDSDKGSWVQGRFAWMLGEMYNHALCADHADRDRWLDAAISCGKFLEDHCFDPADGRMHFHLTRDGRPLRKRRYAFSESFAAIAFGELAKATGESRYAELATRCFEKFVNHSTNPVGVQPKFTNVRPTRGIGFPMIATNVAQQLRDTIGLAGADEQIDRSIAEIRDVFMKPDIECVMETVGPKGELIDHYDGRTLNPGHAIEGAWFVMAEGVHRNDDEMKQAGCQMLDWMWRRGWDEEHGGLLYFVGVDGRPVQDYWHDMKFWWPHNEAIIATLLAFKITGDNKYAEMHQQVHDWTHRHFPDPEHGEWYGYLHRDGRISTHAKGNMWKGPFHIPRMQLVCWSLLADSESVT